jgi:hypothetical protein
VTGCRISDCLTWRSHRRLHHARGRAPVRNAVLQQRRHESESAVGNGSPNGPRRTASQPPNYPAVGVDLPVRPNYGYFPMLEFLLMIGEIPLSSINQVGMCPTTRTNWGQKVRLPG